MSTQRLQTWARASPLPLSLIVCASGLAWAVMADGTRLAFVGLERTGGIMVYDISNPAQSHFQDYLNVRPRSGPREAAALREAAAAPLRPLS